MFGIILIWIFHFEAFASQFVLRCTQYLQFFLALPGTFGYSTDVLYVPSELNPASRNSMKYPMDSFMITGPADGLNT